MHEAERQYVQEHLQDEVAALALKLKTSDTFDARWVLQQISARQTIRQKLPDWYANAQLEFPSSLPLEQCSSQTAARFKLDVLRDFLRRISDENGEIAYPNRNLSGADLTGGLGVDASCLSEAFVRYDYVERQSSLCALAQSNFAVLDKRHIRVINGEAEDYLSQMEGPLDFIYLDPARRDDVGRKVAALADCSPDVSALAPQLLKKARAVMLKLSPMLDLSLAVRSLPSVAEVFVVSVDNDCKEMLLLLSSCLNIGNIPVKTVNFRKSKPTQTYCFDLNGENQAMVSYTACLGKYLYEPNAAVMKAGAFKSLTRDFPVQALHPNSHLYTSAQYVEDFPGKIFDIIGIFPPSAKSSRQFLKRQGRLNVSVRNYPSSPAEILKALGIKEGGDKQLFATTLNDESHIWLLCAQSSAPNSIR